MAKRTSHEEDATVMANAEVLSKINQFQVEWAQFRNLWDQLTPSFQHMGTVVKRFEEISHALPLLEHQHAQLTESLAHLQGELAEEKKAIDKEVAKFRESAEREVEPLKKQLRDTREQVMAIQGARADAEKSFEERRFTQEATLKEIEDRLAEAKRQLYAIGQLAGAANV
jgi:chromosome segregation ATPase